jgi:fatty acid-binding protein DegV
VLDIHPIIGVIDGAVVNVGKAKGLKAACKEVMRLAKKNAIDTRYGVAFGTNGNGAAVDALRSMAKLWAGDCEIGEYTVGGVIGTHTGPGAAGFAFIAK